MAIGRYAYCCLNPESEVSADTDISSDVAGIGRSLV
jgi:hypothetical protein